MEQQWQQPEDLSRVENARIGYQVATQLWTYEGQLVWQRFNAMLVVHSIILALIGIGAAEQRSMLLLSIGMPVVGVVLCVMWFLLVKRGFDYYRYWVLSARELEEQYVPPVRTVSRGGEFADGRPISLTIDGRAKPLRMSWQGRTMKAEGASYVTIAVFAVVYLLFLFFN